MELSSVAVKQAAEHRITHTCGHEVKHRFAGPAAQWTTRRRWLEQKPCQTCWQEAQRVSKADENAEGGLPELRGTQDDIAWAEVIRAKAIAHNATFHENILRASAQDEADPTRLAVGKAADHAMTELKDNDAAAWWIEHRFDVLSHVRQATIDAVTAINESPDNSDA